MTDAETVGAVPRPKTSMFWRPRRQFSSVSSAFSASAQQVQGGVLARQKTNRSRGIQSPQSPRSKPGQRFRRPGVPAGISLRSCRWPPSKEEWFDCIEAPEVGPQEPGEEFASLTCQALLRDFQELECSACLEPPRNRGEIIMTSTSTRFRSERPSGAAAWRGCHTKTTVSGVLAPLQAHLKGRRGRGSRRGSAHGRRGGGCRRNVEAGRPIAHCVRQQFCCATDGK